MTDDREQRIREHAYRLWEQEGSPEGRHEHHWTEALNAVEADGSSPDAETSEPSAPDTQASGGVASQSGTGTRRATRKTRSATPPEESASSPPEAEPSAVDPVKPRRRGLRKAGTN
jgi:hypothetical protein